MNSSTALRRNDLYEIRIVVLLVQASMARVLKGLNPACAASPVLTSPRLAVERARTMLARSAA